MNAESMSRSKQIAAIPTWTRSGAKTASAKKGAVKTTAKSKAAGQKKAPVKTKPTTGTSRTAAPAAKKAAVKKQSAGKSAVRKTPVKTAGLKKPRAAVAKTRRTVQRPRPGAELGRPRVAGTAELELMFRNDREAREVFLFLGVKTLKELEALTPEQIVERLTSPVVDTVTRIRKSLAMNNRCLAGDLSFAVAFKKQLP